MVVWAKGYRVKFANVVLHNFNANVCQTQNKLQPEIDLRTIKKHTKTARVAIPLERKFRNFHYIPLYIRILFLLL